MHVYSTAKMVDQQLRSSLLDCPVMPQQCAYQQKQKPPLTFGGGCSWRICRCHESFACFCKVPVNVCVRSDVAVCFPIPEMATHRRPQDCGRSGTFIGTAVVVAFMLRGRGFGWVLATTAVSTPKRLPDLDAGLSSLHHVLQQALLTQYAATGAD